MTWLMSALTILTMWLAGDRHRLAWWVGLANQALWLGYIIDRGEWGLLPMNLAMWAVCLRNALKWRVVADGGSLKGPSRLGASQPIQGAK